MIGLIILAIFITLIVLAIAIIQNDDLPHSVVLFMGFGLGSVILYFLFSAPDVALTEAVIGTGVSGVVINIKRAKIESLNHKVGSKQITPIITSRLPSVEALVPACILVIVSGILKSPIPLSIKNIEPKSISIYPKISIITILCHIKPSKNYSSNKPNKSKYKCYIKIDTIFH